MLGKIEGRRRWYPRMTWLDSITDSVDMNLRKLLGDSGGQRAWCTGTTQRDDMGREEGGRFRMGNTGIPVADSFQYLAKLIQNCKV